MPGRRRRDCIGTPHPVRSQRRPSPASWRPAGDCRMPDTTGPRCSALSAAGRRAQGFACRALPRRSRGLPERQAWLWPQALSGSPPVQPCRAPMRPGDLFGSCCITQSRRLFFESSSRFSLLIEHNLFGKPASAFPDHAPMPKSHFNRHCRQERRESRMSMARRAGMREADVRRPRRDAHQKSSVGQIVFSCGMSDASLPTCRTTGESPSLWRSAKIWPMNSE